jgi:hypothetical protein
VEVGVLPEYQRKVMEQEAEIKRDLQRLGRSEEQQSYSDNTTMDLLGFRDGAPGWTQVFSARTWSRLSSG